MDLYMAGSTFKELNGWLREKNYNKLLSQLNDRGTIEEWRDALRQNRQCQSKLFIDSGAFTAHTKGAELDVDEYIQYLNENEDVEEVETPKVSEDSCKYEGKEKLPLPVEKDHLQKTNEKFPRSPSEEEHSPNTSTDRYAPTL